MSIESKAVSRSELCELCKFKHPTTNDCKNTCEKEKWVPLVGAKKEIEKWRQQQKDDYTTYFEAVSDRDSEIVELKAKIEAANEIITKYDKWFHTKCWQPWIIAEKWKDTFDNLRGALYIPRKEAEDSVELLHRYRNEYAEQGNEESKENTTP